MPITLDRYLHTRQILKLDGLMCGGECPTFDYLLGLQFIDRNLHKINHPDEHI